jgi:putative methionine-R-sulfoxide reductase with GAF domain
MKIITNNVIPPKGFAAINLFGVLFVKKGAAITERTVRHEAIHSRQMKELLYVPFYILYVSEWLVKLPFYGKQAYYGISFEREAYANQNDGEYLKKRRFWAFVRYI